MSQIRLKGAQWQTFLYIGATLVMHVLSEGAVPHLK